MLGRYEEALADLNKAIEMAPLFGGAYNNRGVVFGMLRRLDEQLADLRKSLDLNPNNPVGWTNYGALLVGAGRVEEALEQYEKAIELSPRRTAAHALRASSLAWLERCDEAAAAMARAEEVIESADLQGAGNIASAYYSGFFFNCPDLYDPDVALRYLRLAYEARPELHRELHALALFRNGEYAGAKRLWTEVYEEGSESLWGLGLAMCHWHLGNEAEARKLYEQSVAWSEENYPDDPVRNAMRAEAAELLGLDEPERQQ